MRKILILSAAFIIVVTALGYFAFQHQMRYNLAFNSKVAALSARIEEGTSKAVKTVDGIKKDARRSLSGVTSSMKGSTPKPEAPLDGMVIHLKHGGTMEAKLLSKTKDEYTVEWKGANFVLKASQIDKIEYKTQKEIDWQYKNDVVIRKTNGIVLDGKIIDVNPDQVLLSFDEGGGALEMGVRPEEIDALLFAPVYNAETKSVEDRLKEQFPKMKEYREGNVVLFTDSHEVWVNSYKKSLRRAYTDIYLKFFKLFKGRKSSGQNYIVVFDDFADYANYAITDGVPFWLAVGYFKSTDKTLYIFNGFGDRMEKIVFDVIVGRTGKSIDEIVGYIKKRVDERHHVFIDAHVKELTDKYWDTYSLFKNELIDQTFSTLRHEFAHEIFHNWSLQNIILSKPNTDIKKLTEKKKEFLETKDYKKKEELLMKILKISKEDFEDVEFEASNSWLAEGIATYCATEPLGSIDEIWLFKFQEMEKKNSVNPIEFLMSFKMGSFSGLSNKAKIDAYAQSWAFTNFLMAKHPEQFMEYQARMAEAASAAAKGVPVDELKLFLGALNTDLPAIENEFAGHMKTYPQVEDPEVKRFVRFHEIWSELLQAKN